MLIDGFKIGAGLGNGTLYVSTEQDSLPVIQLTMKYKPCINKADRGKPSQYPGQDRYPNDMIDASFKDCSKRTPSDLTQDPRLISVENARVSEYDLLSYNGMIGTLGKAQKRYRYLFDLKTSPRWNYIYQRPALLYQLSCEIGEDGTSRAEALQIIKEALKEADYSSAQNSELKSQLKFFSMAIIITQTFLVIAPLVYLV